MADLTVDNENDSSVVVSVTQQRTHLATALVRGSYAARTAHLHVNDIEDVDDVHALAGRARSTRAIPLNDPRPGFVRLVIRIDQSDRRTRLHTFHLRLR